MEHNEETEEYTTKDFAKEIAVETGKMLAIQAATYATLFAAGLVVVKVKEAKAKRKAKKEAETEEK